MNNKSALSKDLDGAVMSGANLWRSYEFVHVVAGGKTGVVFLVVSRVRFCIQVWGLHLEIGIAVISKLHNDSLSRKRWWISSYLKLEFFSSPSQRLVTSIQTIVLGRVQSIVVVMIVKSGTNLIDWLIDTYSKLLLLRYEDAVLDFIHVDNCLGTIADNFYSPYY